MIITYLFLTLHFLVATTIAASVSATRREIPFTLAAIVVTYLGMTAGQILALAGIQLDLRKLYSNTPPPSGMS